MKKCLAIVVVTFMQFGFLLAQVGAVSQSEIKAVFLYNFTGFVEWPDAAFAEDNAPLVIGVLGENPFGIHLEEAVLNEKKGAHPLIVKYYKEVGEVKDCHILFVNKQKPDQIQQVIVATKGRSILTVSDAAEFTARGGMIRFFIADNKLRFQVNVEAVKNADLLMSSKLLRLAEIFNAKK